MRHTLLILIAAVLLLSACGAPQSTQPAAQPAAQPVVQATEAPAPPTAAPTEDMAVSPSSAPAPTALPAPTAAPPATAAPLPTAEPTARLILPAGTSQPAATSAPAVTTPQPTAAAAPRATAAQPAAPAAAAQPSQPVRIVIEGIGLDGRLAPVGLDKNRAPIVPKHDIGWYNLSAQPGAGENIVLWGHVLRFRDTPNVPAPFARLKELKPGAAVLLYDKAGGAHRYVVTQQIWVKPDQVEYILPRGKEMVTMVSCIGDKVITGGEVVDMSNRLITIAEPAE